MPIETNFRFNQFRSPGSLAALSVTTSDLLGPLRAFIGNNSQRTWTGAGFNLIWRPHDKSAPNPKDFFLELNITRETLSFSDITGPNGIANRGFLQGDLPLGGLAYQQEVSDVGAVPSKPLHFEPGVWLNVMKTDNPKEDPSLARMGSIPHGTTINAQGTAFSAAKPVFVSTSVMPFSIGAPDDGSTGVVQFNEGKPPITAVFSSRTPASDLPGLTDPNLLDPTTILSNVTGSQNVTSTTVIVINTDLKAINTKQSPIPAAPHEGGGTDNIAFLVGGAAGPNAAAAKMSATFWIETIDEPGGRQFQQLQYLQRVLLNFNGLSWPHVSLATMTVASEKP